MPFGPRITTDQRYIKHPATSVWNWQNGRPVDSGTAHIVHSNLSALSKLNRRHLGSMVGPGAITGYDITKEDGYSLNSIVDASPSTDTNDPLYAVRRIAWVQGFDCLCIGPHLAAPLLLNTSPPGYRPMTITARCVFLQNVLGTGGATITVVFAITQGPAPPNVNDPILYYASSSAGAGTYDTTHQLVFTAPVRATRLLQSRPGSTTTSVSQLLDLYVWVGWFSTNYDTNITHKDAVYLFEAYEEA